ncbi:MAG TPA: hypothetical protein VHD61_13740 [Lacunisphaera sp.]|nr:hypothetical protein [Lacunisphaera sp.]
MRTAVSAFRFIRRGLLAATLVLPPMLFAVVEVAPKPGAAPTDYRKVAAMVEPATFVVITYWEGKKEPKAIVADEKVVAGFKRLIATADGRPASYCFCINYPQVTFLTKDGPLVTVEAAHGKKLRFVGGGHVFDFEVDPELARAFDKLAMAQRAGAINGLKDLPPLDLPKPSPPAIAP